MTIEKATIVAAIMTFITSIISSILAGRSISVTKKGNQRNIVSNEEISKKVQEAEDKRNESQIDANIVWNARVEWIQNVRRVTAEFITACYKYMRAYDQGTQESLDLIEEKKLLLILYFGPDGNEDINNNAVDIYDMNTNNAKNNLMVKLINEIFNQLKSYYMMKETFLESHQELVKCIECEEVENAKVYFCEKNEYGDKFLDGDCIRRKDELHVQENKSYEIIHGLSENLIKLSEAMRVYLKIEWKNTKTREKY